MKYSIQEVAKILKLKESYSTDVSISMLLTDSRKVFYPKESLFFALITSNNDGHKFVKDLYKKGVRNFVVSKHLTEWDNFENCNFLLVKDTLAALQRLAAEHRFKFKIPVVAITGSNGKTIVKEWLYHVLEDKYKISHSPRSYNSQTGVPLSVWQMNENTELGIFEAGISQPEEMSKLENIIKPSVGIITNIGQAHQEGFKSLKQKCLEKLELFIHCDMIICEEENKLIEECMEIACLSHKRMTWSKKGSTKSPVLINSIKKQNNSTEIAYMVLGYESKMTIPFTDDASIENAIHVLTAASYLRATPSEINSKMISLQTVSMRLDLREGKNNCTLINDSYNSDINSIGIALDFLQQQATDKNKKKLLILSDIPQSGMPDKELYKLAASLVVNKRVDELIAIGPKISEHKDCFKAIPAEFFNSTQDFMQSDIWYAGFHDRIILLKGARSFHFEQINKSLEIQTHETVLDIDLDAIVHNFNFYRSKLKPETKMIAMVKANGYGAGAPEIAKILEYHKCDYIAVAVAEEGAALRHAGISIPIIVLNAEVGGFEELYTYNLEPEVYNFRILKEFIQEAKLRGVSNYPIHIKLDTGMHRLGFEANQMDKLEDILQKQSGLRVQSVFSHLAASDEEQHDDYTRKQIEEFKILANRLEKSCGHSILKHILNSAGIERFTEEQMDMVRLGISLYGVSASGKKGLRNVCSLKTSILQIKEIKAGEPIGYGCKGSLAKDGRIATIRLGYADGYNRAFSLGVGEVLVNGQRAPIVGRVCMDLSMIDISAIEAKEGDTVVIFGRDLPISELAKKIDTIPYEILTSVSNRVKHIYYKE